MPATQFAQIVSLDDVLITDAFLKRPTRAPDYRAETQRLHQLAQRLAESRETLLHDLMAITVQVCAAGSAGISLIQDGDPDSFRWIAVAGALASHAGGSTPRDFSPCGVCLDRGSPQAFRFPGRYFTYFQSAMPEIVEGLMIPIVWHGRPLGTIWIVSHTEERRFDREDARIMTSLAGFTAVALRLLGLQSDASWQKERDAVRTEWMRRVMTAQEDERRRVSRDLHDHMGQHITALALGLHALDDPSLPPANKVLLDGMQKLVADMGADVHRLARDLRPPALDDLGLVTTLGNHVEEWSKSTGISADFSTRRCDHRLGAATETTLYRIVQEALTNVARHARAQRASVVLECRRDHMVVIVEDDGCGFASGGDGRGHVGHLGLIGMRERAALLGGTVTIESAPRRGTSLFASLPIRPAHGRADA